VALAAWMSVSACTKAPEPPRAAAAAPAAAPPASSSAGRVDGKGPVPAPGASVVVVLEPKTPRTFPPQDDAPVMDQVGQTFSPALLIVRTGQVVKFRNSDDTLHNVNVKEEGTRVQSFNVAIPTDGVFEFTFPHDGFYRVGCDIHPAMAASLFAASTPYVTLSDGDGGFSFSDVPPGAWTLTVYSAGRKLQRDVEVTTGATQVTIE
jgi:plastocyanin